MLSNWFKSPPSRQQHLTPAQNAERQMYASEKLDNFRWISTIFGTYGEHEMTANDLVSQDICQKIGQVGQFAELVYSSIPLATLVDKQEELKRKSSIFSEFDALQDCVILGSYIGKVADLPAAIFFRPNSRQLIVSISGTASLKQFLYDLRLLKTPLPSGRGLVHSGFWVLYNGVKDELMEGIKEGIAKYSPAELIFTGHSMGGSIAHLLCMDLLAEHLSKVLELNVAISMIVFGTPRTGDAALVDHFHTLVKSFRDEQGANAFTEYSIKGYNDGIPSVPPAALGYQHFCKEPFYTVYGRLYRIPAVESERSLFHVQELARDHDNEHKFPKGGHNYYNNRDLEGFRRDMDRFA